MAADLATVAMAGNKESVADHVRKVKDFGARMVDMADRIQIGYGEKHIEYKSGNNTFKQTNRR